MSFDLNTALTLKLALGLLGGALVLAAGFVAWFYSQILRPPVDDLQIRLRAVENSSATQTGKDLPDRMERLEERVRLAELTIVALETSENQRSSQLTRGLAELGDAIAKLKEDIRRGDIESRVDSGEALVSSLQAAFTLAKLQGMDAQERARTELTEAQKFLEELRLEQRKAATS